MRSLDPTAGSGHGRLRACTGLRRGVASMRAYVIALAGKPQLSGAPVRPSLAVG